MATIYKYNDYEYRDESGEFTTEEVKQQLVQYFPELAQAKAEKSTDGEGNTVITFVKRAGTKGGRRAHRVCAVGIMGSDKVGECAGDLYAHSTEPGILQCARHVRLVDAFTKAKPGLTFVEWWARLSAADRAHAEEVGQISAQWTLTVVSRPPEWKQRVGADLTVRILDADDKIVEVWQEIGGIRGGIGVEYDDIYKLIQVLRDAQDYLYRRRFAALTQAALDIRFLIVSGGGMATKTLVENVLLARYPDLKRDFAHHLLNTLEVENRTGFIFEGGQARWTEPRPAPERSEYPELSVLKNDAA